jgi:hypothetical protein
MFQDMMGLGQLSKLFNHGLIVLILKLGEHSLMGNQQPIVLFGSIFKILVKLFLNQLQTQFLDNNSPKSNQLCGGQ